MSRGYEAKSEELARYFMSDGEDVPEEVIADLAQTIQDAIEDWFIGWDPVTRRHSSIPRCQARHPEGGQCELRAGHDFEKHFAGTNLWPADV